MADKKGLLSFGEILAYSLGLAGVQVIIGYMNSYQAQYYMAVKGSLVNLSIIALILLAAKLISAFADPFIGKWIDQGRFKGGKLKPFVLIGLCAFAVMSTVIFLGVPFSGAAMYAYIFVTFLLWSISMTLLDIPTQGMLSIISPHACDRNNAAGVANLIKGGGSVACFVIMPVVCIILKTGDRAMGQREYLVSTVFIVILAAALVLLLWGRTKERVPYSSTAVSTKEMLHIIKGNRPLLLVFISGILGFGRTMSSAIQVQAAAVLMDSIKIGSIVISSENAGLIMGLGATVSGAISGILMPFINKRWGEKKTFVVFALYGLAVCAGSFAIYALGFTSTLTILICLFLVGFMYGPHTFLPLVMLPDCIDYYELKTGKRTDGIHFAVLSLSTKIAAAMCVAFGLLMVGVSGYVPGCIITEKMKLIVYAAYVLVPGICCVLAMLPILSYKLVGGEKKRIADELEARRSEQDAIMP